jgi:FAD/FMN-containing dehydrogenase
MGAPMRRFPLIKPFRAKNFRVKNFGRNLNFCPANYYAPTDEAALLTILQQHRHDKIRAIGARHAWSDGIKTPDVVVDLKYFQQIQIHPGQNPAVTVGAGCRIKTILAALNAQGLTLPVIGVIAEQSIAGAIATGTHGSGNQSLSHYVQSVRIAGFDPTGQTAQIHPIAAGDDLRAARCALGALGIITSVTLPCVPQYWVQEQATPCRTIEAALAMEIESPLQQFFLMPQQWEYVVQRRQIPTVPGPQGQTWLYRLYWLCNLDFGLHLLIKLFAGILRRRQLVHWLFRSLMPRLLMPDWVVTDRSDRQLLIKHDLFRHFELEAFVPRSQVIAASHFITDILQLADDANHKLTAQTTLFLTEKGLDASAQTLGGTFTHHYPICFRRVCPDDTLISMTAGAIEDWYAISFITYAQPRDDFQGVAEFLARSLLVLFQARIHWGKWFPLGQSEVAQQYPRLAAFGAIRDRYDPNGVFRNQFIADKLG